MAPSKLPFEIKLLLLVLLSSVPSAIGLVAFMIKSGISVYLTAMVAIVLTMVIAWCTATVVGKTSYLFRTLSNLLEAMTKGDYSLRGRKEHSDSALDNLVCQINMLSETLAKQRIEVKEHQLLLAKVIKQIDVAIIAMDERQEITLANPAAQKLLENSKTLDLEKLKHSGKYNIHHDRFIEEGKQQQLWFITDVRDLLRAQERKAWQNLIRVLSHEINNSLTPISSISQTLGTLVSRSDDIREDKADLEDGLLLINERAKALKSFIDSYRALSRLPQPKKQNIKIKALLEKVTGLFEQQPIDLQCDEKLTCDIDPVQFEQLLINLVKNAIEAMQNTPGKITIECTLTHLTLTLFIKDEGPGINNPDNLFVPFYTTKPNGSGTGLVLSRQIVEAHGGDLMLRNRDDRQGCEVVITLLLTNNAQKARN